jgi:hypothetical protein
VPAPGARRILVVANRTAATPTLIQEVERRAARRPCTFTLLIPDAPRSDATDWTLDVALPLLEAAARGPVRGLTGGEDAFAAIERVLAAGDYQEIIVSTLPRRLSTWLRRDLPRRVEDLGLPVTVIELEGEKLREAVPAPGPIRLR